MGTFLFDRIIFGPVYSRRLGQSLGLNLLPKNRKICTFNCVYCECGWTDSPEGGFVSTADFELALELKLQDMRGKNETADALTFAGNGEPTIHPDFGKITRITIRLRDKYMPQADIAVLSNSTTLDKPDVFEALNSIEKNIMKLDAGTEETFRLINQPLSEISLEQIVNNLQKFKGKLIIQTLLLKGNKGNISIDNTTETELHLLGSHLQKIKPELLMLYSIARGTPLETLTQVSPEELQKASALLSAYIPECDIQIF
jgi:wyosine [tRNA(Phe)-imidazoG37] synthetase (radical SAM superfamily)